MQEIQRAHYSFICNDTGAVTARTTETTPTTAGKIDVAPPGFTHLQTARIWIMDTKDSASSRVVFWTLAVNQASSLIF